MFFLANAASCLRVNFVFSSQVSRAMRKWRFASWMEGVKTAVCDRFFLAELFFLGGFSILLCEEKGFAGGSKKDSD